MRHARGSPGTARVVAMVTDAIYPFHLGGKEVRYRHLAAGLARRGVEVHVFTMRWWEGPRHRVDEDVHYHALCRPYPLYRRRRRSILEAVWFSLACLRLLAHRFDLIEADDMPLLPLFPLRLVAALRRVPLVVTWHEYWGRDYWKRYLGAAGVLATWIERRALQLGDVVVTPSPGTRERLVAQGVAPERVRVVPNGLDLAAIASVEPSRHAFDLLFVGRLVEHKHVDLLVHAVATLQGAGQDVSCGILGAGPERAGLEALVDRLGVQAVRFLGTVDHQSEVFALMKAARVFVLPSTREGFGIVVAEAIACGCLVVTTDHVDNHARALVEPGVTGWLCHPTASSLAQAIDEALGRSRSQAAAPPASLERFAWGSSVEMVKDVLESTIAGRRGG